MNQVTIVTGGAGFIGSHLVGQLIESSQSVRVIEIPGTDVEHLPAGVEVILAGEPKAPDPEIIAKAVLDAVTAVHPPVRHASLPMDSKMANMGRWLLGCRIFSWVMRSLMKI